MDETKARLYQNIIDYYNIRCESFLSGANRETLAMHAGFTDESAQEFIDTLTNMNRVLADWAGIRAGEKILDAGCGVGGSAIWLAKNRGAQVTGISIVERQLEYARRFALEDHVEGLADFSAGDFLATPFKAEGFDVVWAIESVCYAMDKRGFVREARRILKPGGRLIVADGFQTTRELPAQDQALMDSWLSAWVVPELATPEQFFFDLREEKFTSIRFEDVTRNVMPFSIRLFQDAIVYSAKEKHIDDLSLLTPSVLDDIRGTRDQLVSLSTGLWVYGIFCGVKPS
jgi:ubiquinone/menaquinone biosynthesis C-methylase UbiE